VWFALRLEEEALPSSMLLQMKQDGKLISMDYCNALMAQAPHLLAEPPHSTVRSNGCQTLLMSVAISLYNSVQAIRCARQVNFEF